MTQKTAKLRLNRETVRELDRKELEQVEGGQYIPTNPCVTYSEGWCNIPTLRGCIR